jgi:hypothetical protein
MHGIRPEALSDAELVRFAEQAAPEALPPVWVAEIIKRLDTMAKDFARLEAVLREVRSATERYDA